MRENQTRLVVWIAEHRQNSCTLPHPSRAFVHTDVAEKYIWERALSYSAECLMAYDNMEAELESPIEASFKLTPAAL